MASVKLPLRRCAARRWTSLALALALVGCGSGPMTMDLRPTNPEAPRHAAAREIRIALIPTAATTAGVLGSRTIKPEGLDTRLTTRLESLGNSEYRVIVVSALEAPTAPPPAITISLAKAYVQQVHDSKSGVVVLKVEQAGQVHYLRGQSTGLNWWGSSEEMAAALTEALDEALRQLRPQLADSAVAAPAPPAQP